MKEQLSIFQEELNQLEKTYGYEIQFDFNKYPHIFKCTCTGTSYYVAIAITKLLKSGKCPEGLTIALDYFTEDAVECFLYAKYKGPQGLTASPNSDIADETARVLSYALKSGQCPPDLTLDLSDKNISSKGAKKLFDALKSGRCSKGLYLDLTRNEINDDGAEALAEALINENCPQNLRIGLPRNKIGVKGATALADALNRENGSKGLMLDLSDNKIGDEGAKAFGAVLLKNTSLKRLGLGFNQFGKVAVDSLLKGLFYNYTLESLIIDNLTLDQQEFVDSCLKRNRSHNLSNFSFFKSNSHLIEFDYTAFYKNQL